jgi:exodeoxyribonuclease VII large subunit
MKPVDPFARERKVWTVSEISRQIRELIEPRFPDVWVLGEVSNLRSSPAGHIYFTLKDERAQIPAVCFRNAARFLRFRPKNGESFRARGRIGTYEGRGEYQIVVEVLEPAGRGRLDAAFLRLKEKLEGEGLFDPSRKRPLPRFPIRIGIVSSPRSAAIRDLLTVLRRRHNSIGVLIYPTEVQGSAAAGEIARGVRELGRMEVDLVIVTRGGGSVEDLWAFNEEQVARAIAACPVPVVSAVGHETDFTISDFVADVRAPTPSAAGEIVSATKRELIERLEVAEGRMKAAVRYRVSELRRFLAARVGGRGFVVAEARIGRLTQRVDEYTFRLKRVLSSGELAGRVRRRIEDMDGRSRRNLSARLDSFQRRVADADRDVSRAMKTVLADRRERFHRQTETLDALSPLAVLDRGYSVCRTLDGRLVRSASGMDPGTGIEILLHEGRLEAEVTRRHFDDGPGKPEPRKQEKEKEKEEKVEKKVEKMEKEEDDA